MHRLVFAVLLTAAVTGFAAGQCPQITVTGAAGIPAPGEPVAFTVQIDPPEWASRLSFLWTVRSGDREVGMVRGQGTQTILAPWNHDGMTVTVKVIGVPPGCADTASEVMFVDAPPIARKLIELRGRVSKTAGVRLREAIVEAKKEPTAQVYIMIYGTDRNTAASIHGKRNAILKLLREIYGHHIDTRITFLDVGKGDRIVVWLVPAGADRPNP